jgi:hypothetical protein
VDSVNSPEEPDASASAAPPLDSATAAPPVEEKRPWRAGRLEPMPIRELPKAPPSVHLLGPTVFLLALGVGIGESYQWPRLVLVFGPNIRWLFLVGVTLQAFVMLEMARYAMATGESIFFGAARVFKPLMWLFFVTAIAVYIWPGHVSAGAGAFEEVTGIPWNVTATIALLVVGVVISMAKVIYSMLEKMLGFLIGALVLGTAVIAAVVGSWSDLSSTLTGMFHFGFLPDTMMNAAWFPTVVGACAFAGPSGMQQMWYTLYLRDSSAGMGVHIPRVRGLTHANEEETIPSRGFMFDTDNPDEMRKWKGWRRWITFDAVLLFWGVTMLVTIAFTVIARAAASDNPNVSRLLLQADDDQSAALQAISNTLSGSAAPIVGTLFLLFISVIGLNATFGLFDAFSRGQADMTYFFVPGARRFKMSHIYAVFLWGVIIFGIIILNFGPADGPSAVLDTLAFLSTFAMGAYCVVLLLVNNRMLPKPIRPGILNNGAIALGAVFYLGMLIFSIVQYGVVVG